MSNLYIRVRTGFYTNKKTAKLRVALGNDAFWIPPRLWAYAAENQPDGDMSGYTSETLSMLLGCDKHATSMLQALKESGFIDPDGKIHDWAEHNGYHESFAKRAKIAATARWSKSPSTPPSESGNRKGERGDKHSLEHATRMLDALKFVKPTQEELEAEFVKHEMPKEKAIEFLAYYESNGWKVGRNPMKSWKSAVVTWKVSHNKRANNGTGDLFGHQSNPDVL